MFEFEQHKILILHGSSDFTRYKNIKIAPMYRQLHGIEKILHKLWEHLPYLKQSCWYEDWKNYVAEVDTILIMDGIRGRDVIEYIRKKNPQARIIIYFVNTIDHGSRKDPDKYKGLGCEFAVFDRQNAKDWHIRFKHYYYEYALEAKTAMYNRRSTFPKYDAFFIGVDKNRLDTLLKLKNEFEKMGLREKFIVVKTKHQHYPVKKRAYIIDENISYEQIIHYILQSRAILDIMADNQNGLTLRPMEAMFFKKKLITNNADIINYNFYNSENIFILGQRPLEEIPAFLDEPVREVPEDILDEYRMENWLEDFFL